MAVNKAQTNSKTGKDRIEPERIRIRKFQQSDMEQVLDIWLEASIKAHDFVDSAFWKSKVQDMREIYIPLGETYVYDEEGIIKGFVSLYKDTVAALFVSPDFQRKGIGQQLLKKAKEVRNELNLTVYRENPKAVAFYRKCGFWIETERIDRHTGHPELLMKFDSGKGDTW